MADRNPTKSPDELRAAIDSALVEARTHLIGATAVLSQWLGADSSTPHAADADLQAEPADADFCTGVEKLIEQADRLVGEAQQHLVELNGTHDQNAAHRELFGVWVLIAGLAQIVCAAGLADDQGALRPEGGTAVLALLARCRDGLEIDVDTLLQRKPENAAPVKLAA